MAPQVKGFDVDFWHQAYQDVPGGDFIDFIEVDERYSTTEALADGARDADAGAACVILEQFLRSLP